jgi:lipopolysaccharide transport system ATP-binding protein
MSTPAISVEGLGKLYQLSHQAKRHHSFREAIADMALAPIRRFRELRGNDQLLEDFWALRGVNFEVQPGEVVGIVGRNGAGKSTLLKILSRIVEPTEGRATMRGRVASLLEVGTGFHPELSGRENIYLNGSILGMKKREIEANFDAIVAFAEVERFLDTPVKRYSSGMYVRLAFAVAAHLEPEILIVDEVLAVGDAEFQKKCLGKMKDISTGGGRTVLFVSHNMAAVRGLCNRGVLLQRGRVELVDTAEQVVTAYMAKVGASSASTLRFKRPRHAQVWMTSASLLIDGQAGTIAPMGADLCLEITFDTGIPIKHPRFGFVINTNAGERILSANNRYQPSPAFDEPRTTGIIECNFGSPPLMPGQFTLSLYMGDMAGDQHTELDAIVFEVIERDLWGQGQIPPRGSHFWWPAQFKLKDSRLNVKLAEGDSESV